MEELLARKKSIEKELDAMPKLAKARRVRGVNICGMVFFSLSLSVFTIIMWFWTIEVFFDFPTSRSFYDVCFAFFAVICPPIAILGAAMLLAHKISWMLSYVLPALVGWVINIILMAILEDITPHDFRWWLSVWMILGCIVFFQILPFLLFALTFPPFKGYDPGYEELSVRKEELLMNYYYLSSQMEMISPMIAGEMRDKYEDYRMRKY